MPFYIKNDDTAQLVDKLPALFKQDAVRLAVTVELERTADMVPLRVRFARLRAAHPLPPPTGAAADKAFFDELSAGYHLS